MLILKPKTQYFFSWKAGLEEVFESGETAGGRRSNSFLVCHFPAPNHTPSMSSLLLLLCSESPPPKLLFENKTIKPVGIVLNVCIWGHFLAGRGVKGGHYSDFLCPEFYCYHLLICPTLDYQSWSGLSQSLPLWWCSFCCLPWVGHPGIR